MAVKEDILLVFFTLFELTEVEIYIDAKGTDVSGYKLWMCSGWFGGALSAASSGTGGSGYLMTEFSFKPAVYCHTSSKYWFKKGFTMSCSNNFTSYYRN